MKKPQMVQPRFLPMVGDRVRCNGFRGIGLIQKVRALRYEARVLFGSISVWRPFEDLELVDAKEAAPPATVTTDEQP